MSGARTWTNGARYALLPLALVIAFVAITKQAHAAELTLQSCAQNVIGHPDEASSDGWLPSKSSGPLVPNGACPAGLSFNTSAAVALGATSSWAFSLSQRPVSNNVKLTIEGADGSTGFRYSIAGCDGCAPFFNIPATRDGAAGAEQLNFDAQNVTKLQVRAACTLDPCQPAAPLVFHDVKLGVTDVTAPTVPVFGNSLAWQRRASFRPTISVMDSPGVGLKSAFLRIDGNTTIWSTGDLCNLVENSYGTLAYGRAELCQSHPASSTGMLSLPSLKDGRHALELTAVDGVGNQTKVQGPESKLDDTVPETPEDITVSDVDEGGWTAKESVNFAMAFPASDASVGEQSPLEKFEYTRRSIDPPGATSEPFTKFGSTSVSPLLMGFQDVAVPADGTWSFWFWATDEAGNPSGKAKIQVRRDRTTPQPPEIADNPWINRQDLIAGYKLKIESQSIAGLESGVCSYLVTTNVSELSNPLASTPKIRMPVTQLPIPASTPATDKWAHVRSVSCAGLASAYAAHSRLRIDESAPTIISAGISESGWLNTAPTVTLSAADSDSGIQNIKYRIDAGPEQSIAADSTTFTIPTGDHTLSYWAIDNAENASDPVKRKLKIDTVPPHVAFGPRDQSQPTLLTASAVDLESGVIDARIQYRRLEPAELTWRDLPTAGIVDPTNAERQLLSATIPDAELPAGSYAFQITAVDAAGNWAASESIGATGVPMRAALPVRSQNRLTVALAKPVKKCNSKKRACDSDFDISGAKKMLETGLGRRIAVVGELRDSGGAPIADRKVTILQEIGGNPRAQVASVATDASGKYRYATTARASARLIAVLTATGQELEARGSAELRVAARAKLIANKTVIRAGDTLRFSGELLGSATGFSRAKVPIVLEFLNGQVPQTGIDRAKTDVLGNFKTPGYRWKSVPKRAYVLKIRAAVVAGSTSWPFDDGYSNWVSIKIRR